MIRYHSNRYIRFPANARNEQKTGYARRWKQATAILTSRFAVTSRRLVLLSLPHSVPPFAPPFRSPCRSSCRSASARPFSPSVRVVGRGELGLDAYRPVLHVEGRGDMGDFAMRCGTSFRLPSARFASRFDGTHDGKHGIAYHDIELSPSSGSLGAAFFSLSPVRPIPSAPFRSARRYIRPVSSE